MGGHHNNAQTAFLLQEDRALVLFHRAAADVVAPLVHHRLEVRWQLGFEQHIFAFGGVLEADGLGVKRLSWHQREAVADKLLVFAERGALEDAVPSVRFVIEERVADVLHVYAYLVRATRLELTFHKCHITKAFQYSPVGDGVLTALVVLGKHGHDHAVFGMAAHIAHDGALILVEIAPHQCPVLAFEVVVEEDLGETHLGQLVFCDHHKAGGVLVDAVHQQGLHGRAVGLPLVLEIVAQRVDQCAGVVAEGGMHHHAGLLVDDDEVVILVDDVDGYVFRIDLRVAGRVGHQDGDHIVGMHLVVLPLGLAVHQDATGFRRLLYLVARGVADQVEQVFVNAEQLRAGIDHETIMLVQDVFRVVFF